MTNSFFEDEDKYFEEFAKSKEEDEKKLMKILEDMVKEMNEENQLSLKRDYESNQFEELTPDKQIFADIQYLATHCN